MKVRTRAVHIMAVMASAWAGSGSAMQPLDDAEMSSVRAQEGVSIGLEVRLNTDASGNPLGSMTNCGSGDFTQSECRFGLNAEGRPDEWVLFRGVYGSLLINDIRLDAGVLSDAGAPDGYFDSARFEDPGGACLLPDGNCANDSDLENDPALVFEYPATSTSYTPGSQTSSGYTSLEVGYTIEETRLVFGTDGFNNTSTAGSFMGLQISDNNAARAGIAISGQAYVYGF